MVKVTTHCAVTLWPSHLCLFLLPELPENSRTGVSPSTTSLIIHVTVLPLNNCIAPFTLRRNQTHTAKQQPDQHSSTRSSSMARRLIPLLDRVLIEKITAPTKSAGGVLLPESAVPKVGVLPTTTAAAPGDDWS